MTLGVLLEADKEYKELVKLVAMYPPTSLTTGGPRS